MDERKERAHVDRYIWQLPKSNEQMMITLIGAL